MDFKKNNFNHITRLNEIQTGEKYQALLEWRDKNSWE